MTTTRGLAHSIGDGHHTGSVDIAPATRDGQPMLAIWACPEEGEPALLDIRSVLLLAARLPGAVAEAIALAAAHLEDDSGPG